MQLIIDQKEFDTRTAYYTGKSAKKEVTDFHSWVFSCVARYVETGDIQMMNNAMQGARNVSRLRSMSRVLPLVCAHAFDKNKAKFTGRADKVKLDKLRKGDAYKEKFINALNSEQTHQAKASEWTWEKSQKILERQVAKAIENGITLEQVLASIQASVMPVGPAANEAEPVETALAEEMRKAGIADAKVA